MSRQYFYLRIAGIIIGLFGPIYKVEALVDLTQSFQSALKVNQLEAINSARINQTHEQVMGSKSSNYPKISLKGTYTKQENLSDTRYAYLNLAYSLYKGGRDQTTELIYKNSEEIAIQNKKGDALLLYQNVITVFYNYFMNINDTRNLELLAKQSNDRVNEIQKRVSIGRSRVGELLQAKAQLAQARSQLENAKGLVQESAEKYRVLTGIEQDRPIVDLNQNTKKYQLEKLLEKAYERPEVAVRELKINEAKYNVNLSKEAHLPTLDLTSNYYLTKRTGTSYANSKTNWDMGLVLTIPLFEGFGTEAKVKENIEKEREVTASYLDYKKTLEQDIVSRFEIYNRYVNQMETFEEAQALSKKSYEEALKDYRLGLISNLDVLTALNLYLDTKKNAEKNKILALMSEKLLEAGLGVLP